MGMSKNLFLTVASILHFLVDCLCLLAIYLIIKTNLYGSAYILNLFLIYNFLAFATQPLWGLISDRFGYEKLFAISGAILVIIGASMIYYSPIISVIFCGIGNAIFHIGAGSLVLQLYTKRFFPIGVFVAPGAIGITLGILASSFAFDFRIILTVLILITILMLSFTETTAKNYKYHLVGTFKLGAKHIITLLSLLLIAVFLRAFTGSIISFSWKTDVVLLWLLTFSISLGKGFGGLFADKFGWFKTSVLALSTSAILLGFFAQTPSTGIIGSFLFNLTMPITLFLTYKILNTRPGLAFGLTCLGLYFGSLITYTDLKYSFSNGIYIAFSIILGLLALLIAYKLYFNKA